MLFLILPLKYVHNIYLQNENIYMVKWTDIT